MIIKATGLIRRGHWRNRNFKRYLVVVLGGFLYEGIDTQL